MSNEYCLRVRVGVNLYNDGNISVFMKIDDVTSLKYNSTRLFFTEFKSHRKDLFVQELKNNTS